MGFLRQKQDGSTSLKFLTGNVGVIPGTDNDRPVTLGKLIGKVKQGTGSIQGFREDRRNMAKAHYPLYYGAYSSHGPSYDSTFANLTKEETELVHSTYCDPAGVQYAESVLNFSRNCDYAMYVVDHLLDILTGNEHRKTSKYIDEMKTLRKEDELMDKAFIDVEEVTMTTTSDEQDAKPKEIVDFDALKTLQDDGIDMSFLGTLQSFYAKNEAKKPENMLEANADLIDQLKSVQNDRLSSTPPQHFSQMPKAGEKEVELASSIQANLVDMVSQVKPSGVLPEASVRSVLGLGVKAQAPPNEPMQID